MTERSSHHAFPASPVRLLGNNLAITPLAQSYTSDHGKRDCRKGRITVLKNECPPWVLEIPI